MKTRSNKQSKDGGHTTFQRGPVSHAWARQFLRFLGLCLLTWCLDCATLMSIGVRGMHAGNEPSYIPLTTAGFILDEAIAYPIVVGATAPSFGWFYGGFALFMYIVDTWKNIFS